MLLIPCPWCGPRDEVEFVCGGPAGIARPAAPEAASDAEWSRYLHERENPRGLARERWLHRHGCGQWFLVERDTATHAIAGSARIGGG
jgi:heterotetrameric sarcosine oxidase delta subunit